MKGILFKADMIRAIVEGRKTQTRRLITPQPANNVTGYHPHGTEFLAKIMQEDAETGLPTEYVCGDVSARIKPRYRAGEVVYIKEAWRYFGGEECEYQRDQKCVIYKNDVLVNLDIYKWRNPRTMPAWAARYFIKILDVTPQRLKLPLSPEDFEAEGGEQALEILEKINSLWVFKYVFKGISL